MSSRSRPQDIPSNMGEIYFEPIGSIETPGSTFEPPIKQDVPSEDGFPRGRSEDARLRSIIGAYRDTHGTGLLPAEKGFSIQIGSKMFRLSGASIMSDAPSYFSRFFEEQVRSLASTDGAIRTLYIDRDPETFGDIARHLQGYYVHPRDGQHYVKLFADAQFYSLPKLSKQLIGTELDVKIGGQQFKIPMSVFSSPGDSPNYFTLAFGMFVNSKEELYPGLDREGLIRPPPMEEPNVPGKSAKIFEDLLQLLRGYPVKIRDPDHRAALLKDCRYYNLKGVEQKVVSHDISFNPQRQRHEVSMRIEDLRQTGLSIRPANNVGSSEKSGLSVSYARPYTDDEPCDLIVEIGDSNTMLYFNEHDNDDMHLSFFNQTKARVTSLFQVIKNKLSSIKGTTMPTIIDMDNTAITLGEDAYIILDGKESNIHANISMDDDRPRKKVHTAAGRTIDPYQVEMKGGSWTIAKGQWRIWISEDSHNGHSTGGLKIGLEAVKLEAYSNARATNQARRFLSE